MPTRKKAPRRKPRLPLMRIVLILLIVAVGASVAYWVSTKSSSKGSESSWGSGHVASPGEVVILGAYISCYHYEERNGTLLALGGCELVIDVLNTGTRELFVYGILLPGAGISVPINRSIQPGKGERLVEHFNLTNATPIELVGLGYLVTSAGRAGVEFTIAV